LTSLLAFATGSMAFVFLGTLGLVLCFWLFIDVGKRLGLDSEDDGEEREAAPSPQLLGKHLGGMLVVFSAILVLYRTRLLIADMLLLAAAATLVVSAYRARVLPLAQAGATPGQVAALVASLGLWIVPFLWFIHLHLVVVYGRL